jgi:alpha-galactosidase
MSKALNATKRPILYSLCNWGEDGPWNWAPTMSNSWRMSGDVYDSFSRPDERCPCTGDEEGFLCTLTGFHCSILNILNKMAKIVSKTQPGAQNDMDMLEVGNGGMSDDEYKVHMSLWALNSSPLIIGTDVRKLDWRAYGMYANPAVLALNQDPTVSAAVRVWRYPVPDKDEYGAGDIQLWVSTMNNRDAVVALVNAGNNSRAMNASLSDIFQDNGGILAPQYKLNWDVYDLWANRMDNATAAKALNGTLPALETKAQLLNQTARWNASVLSWAEGLNQNASALFGKKVGSLKAGGTLKMNIPRHGIGLYRLRSTGSGLSARDEL